MGEGAREGGAWVGCAGGRFAGCFSGRPFTQEYIATVSHSNMNEGKRGSISGLRIVVVPRLCVLFCCFWRRNSTGRFWAKMLYFDIYVRATQAWHQCRARRFFSCDSREDQGSGAREPSDANSNSSRDKHNLPTAAWNPT